MPLMACLLCCLHLSGNQSKVWNKFDCFCISLAGLPIHERRKFQNINFICCSNNVPVMDMAEGIVSNLLELEHGIEVYDASLGRRIFVITPVIAVLCDNARGSELVNHMGVTH